MGLKISIKRQFDHEISRFGDLDQLHCQSLHGTRLHEGTSRYEDLFESLTKMWLNLLYKACARVNIGPMDQPLKLNKY